MMRMGLGLSLRQRSSGAFSPASLFPAAGAYYDPSDLSTLFQDSAGTTPVTASGQPVGKMLDKSGNGNHLVQATAGSRPLYQTGGFLLFDGVDDSLAVTFAAMAQPLDRLSALRLDTWAANRYILDGGAADELILRQSNTGVSPDLNQFAGAAGANNSAAALGAAHVVSEYYSGASSSLQVDASAVATSVGIQGCTGLTIGLRPGGAVPCPVKVYGLIIRAGTMNAGQLASARAWLAGKAGL